MKRSGESFNGVECVRYDPESKTAYVSVGFKSTPTIDLEFPGANQIEFVEIARYYDARKAAYSLSLDNWGFRERAHPGSPWNGADDDRSDNYQAALAVCRSYDIPVSIAINTQGAGGEPFWQTLQAELDRGDRSWEPAVHAETHPCNAAAYAVRGYHSEIARLPRPTARQVAGDSLGAAHLRAHPDLRLLRRLGPVHQRRAIRVRARLQLP